MNCNFEALKMYRYKIGYHSYEESEYILFEHENLFTHEELMKIVGEATIIAIKEGIDGRDRRVRSFYVHSFQDVFPEVVDILERNYGFVQITYNEVLSVFGWGSLFTNDDWKADRDDDLIDITNIVRLAGYAEKDDDHLRKES